MRTLAILPVKTFGAAKQRLSGLLGSGSRQALAQAMFSDVLASLRHVPALDAIAVVTADRTAESMALSHRVQVIRDAAEAGQSYAALLGIRHALQGGFERVLLVPGDTPLLDPGELASLLSGADEGGPAAVVVPDRHGGGTNALLLAPPDALEPSFGPGSLERHVAAARERGTSHAVEHVPSLALDIDTPEDLAELAAELGEHRGHAPRTRGALRQIDRLHPTAPSAPRRDEVPARA
jgi:2-phospho-L-lactate/phosphoenolpyruvate guanylyltransferase